GREEVIDLLELVFEELKLTERIDALGERPLVATLEKQAIDRDLAVVVAAQIQFLELPDTACLRIVRGFEGEVEVGGRGVAAVERPIASADPAARAQAYDALIRSYWRPVDDYVRMRWRRDPADAQDLTEEFFTRAFEKEYLARYGASKARFRTFLRTCLEAFL